MVVPAPEPKLITPLGLVALGGKAMVGVIDAGVSVKAVSRRE